MIQCAQAGDHNRPEVWRQIERMTPIRAAGDFVSTEVADDRGDHYLRPEGGIVLCYVPDDHEIVVVNVQATRTMGVRQAHEVATYTYPEFIKMTSGSTEVKPSDLHSATT